MIYTSVHTKDLADWLYDFYNAVDPYELRDNSTGDKATDVLDVEGELIDDPLAVYNYIYEYTDETLESLYDDFNNFETWEELKDSYEVDFKELAEKRSLILDFAYDKYRNDPYHLEQVFDYSLRECYDSANNLLRDSVNLEHGVYGLSSEPSFSPHGRELAEGTAYSYNVSQKALADYTLACASYGAYDAREPFFDNLERVKASSEVLIPSKLEHGILTKDEARAFSSDYAMLTRDLSRVYGKDFSHATDLVRFAHIYEEEFQNFNSPSNEDGLSPYERMFLLGKNMTDTLGHFRDADDEYFRDSIRSFHDVIKIGKLKGYEKNGFSQEEVLLKFITESMGQTYEGVAKVSNEKPMEFLKSTEKEGPLRRNGEVLHIRETSEVEDLPLDDIDSVSELGKEDIKNY